MVLVKTTDSKPVDMVQNTWQPFFQQATAFTPLASHDKSIVGFKVSLHNAAVESMDLYVNTSTHLLSSCVLYYREKFNFDKKNKSSEPDAPKVVMNYTKIDTNPTFGKAFFSIDKYVTNKGKKWQLTAAYKNWQLIVR